MELPESFETLLRMPEHHYGAILTDPPWDLVTSRHKTIPFYDLLSFSTMAEMEVSRIAAPNCVLFMWTIASYLPTGIRLMREWGFRYRTIAFIWEKTLKHDPTRTRMGVGHWTRRECEVCLLAIRGHPQPVSRSVRQIIRCPIREHSRKPEEQYKRIEALTRGPYVELFARERHSGWDTWGNQVDHFKASRQRTSRR